MITFSIATSTYLELFPEAFRLVTATYSSPCSLRDAWIILVAFLDKYRTKSPPNLKTDPFRSDTIQRYGCHGSLARFIGHVYF